MRHGGAIIEYLTQGGVTGMDGTGSSVETNDWLQLGISRAASALQSHQRPDGHWVFPLEADTTIPAEYVLLQHHLDEVDEDLGRKIGVYLRERQLEEGGWPLFQAGAFNISTSVKAYAALKAIGDPADAPHMIRARQAILAHGGAATANVFTRIQMALMGAVPWRAVPVMPVEIMHLPRWFPFHLDKVSYWSRTVIVPLLVVMTKRPQARRKVDISELFVRPPSVEKQWGGALERSALHAIFRAIDAVLRVAEPLMPRRSRDKAIGKAVKFIEERLNGEDGLGGIYPAMANTVMMYDCLGYDDSYRNMATAKSALRHLIVDEGERAYCQPCLSPVWDTVLASHAMLEVGGEAPKAVEKAADWLVERQVTDVVGDWAVQRPDVKPGGWAFEYRNDHYPDLDDTAAVVMALDRLGREKDGEAIDRAVDWLVGLQSKNGGWASFDADNTHHYLNKIPFADHGALLDPPTADVTARVLGMLGQLGRDKNDPAVDRALAYLEAEQEADGSWFGRWGTNYIYGTWSVLSALNGIGVPSDSPMMRRAVAWLLAKQREDGGWGEDGASYWDDAPRGEMDVSTASQTAWALLGLMAAGEVDNPAVEKGIRFLVERQAEHGLWDEDRYTAVGFPKVFYLRYHGYPAYFPLWAMARYRNLKDGNARQVMHGI